LTMLALDKPLIAKLDTTTFNFQKIIIDRLKLYDFTEAAITSYCLDKSKKFEGYDFKAFKDKFRLAQFKKDSEIKSIEYDKMIQVGNNFVKNELADSIFVLNMANFEQWILNSMRITYMKYPSEIFKNEKQKNEKQEKQIDITLVKESVDLDDLWGKIIERYLIGLTYDGMKKLLNKFLKLFDIKKAEITTDIVDKINENSQCRHLIVHNHKIVNDAYIEKSGKHARFKKNEQIVISEEILFEEGDNLLRFMQDFRNIFARRRRKNK